jgi:hypothetical protein
LRKGLAEIFEIGRFGALFLYLEMPELGARTQGPGKYCRKVSTWILRTGNAEILCIIELPVGFSVAKAGAGDKIGFLYRDAWFFLPNSGAVVFPR